MLKSRCLFALFVRKYPLKQYCCRRIQFSASVAVKKFLDSENDYASHVLQTMQLQKNAAGFPIGIGAPESALNQQLESVDAWHNDPDKIVELLFNIVACIKNETDGTLSIEDRRFDVFVTRFVQTVPNFTDAQLSRALQALAGMGETASIHDPNYLSLWTSLDNECLERIVDWNVEMLLQMADMWYPLRLARQGKYVNKALWKISNRLRKLSPQQLVKTVFYVNLTRVPLENMMDIEVNFSQNFDAFSIDDVAVLCMGFFKTETPIRSAELLEKIYDKLIVSLASVDDIPLTAILKLLRYSSRIPNVASMERLLTALVPEISRLSLLACLHIALLGSDIHLCHTESLELIIEKFHRNISSLRLKDMERIAFVLAHNNVALREARDEALCRDILAEVPNRVAEIVQYPKCYIALLHFLSMKNIYHPDLISAAFDQRFLQLAYNKNIAGAGREAVTLDAFAGINLSEQYAGNRFPPASFRLVCKLTQDYLPNPKYRLTKSDRMLLDIQSTFQAAYNDHCRIVHLLPHYQRPDVLFCFDERTGLALSLDSFMDSVASHEILTREAILKERSQERNLRLVAIVVGSWNCYVRGVKRRTGGYAMKLHQLKLLNYETVEIPWYEWPVFSRDDMQRYLTSKLVQYFPRHSKTSVRLVRRE
ncbi:AGAP000447-PA-like protein [Anopheles sinensis]|uniref:AGAP000447-PA-like protein n=1 Tax=Anopheles sinensis TaxID=74873 RepID=A0A084VLR1_ANOSI|nr:AGAP000447-PA-like protein [Anopheles sinensis]